jgi:hypothetical protein
MKLTCGAHLALNARREQTRDRGGLLLGRLWAALMERSVRWAAGKKSRPDWVNSFPSLFRWFQVHLKMKFIEFYQILKFKTKQLQHTKMMQFGLNLFCFLKIDIKFEFEITIFEFCQFLTIER